MAVAFGVALAHAEPAQAQVLIDTTPTWDGSFTWGSLCPNGAYGQTFTLAAPATVSSFSFFMKTTPKQYEPQWCEFDPQACMPWEGVTFRAQLLAWDPALSQAVGPILYESTEVYTTTDTLTEYVFQTPALSLPPGTYVALINASGLPNADDARGDMGIAPWYIGDPYNGGSWIDTYPEGEWVFSQCTGAVNPTEYAWSTMSDEIDTAFTLHGESGPTCPDLGDANGNGLPDVVDAQCPCTGQSRPQYVACVTGALNELVADQCATNDDALQAIRVAKRGRCR